MIRSRRGRAVPSMMLVMRGIMLAGMLLPFAAELSAQSVAYVGGVQYAAGDFIFTQRTWSAYFSNGVAWTQGRVRASASIPLVMQPAGWVQYSGAGMMVPTGGMSGTAGTPSATGSMGSMGSMGSGMHGGSVTPSSDMPFSRIGVGDPVGRIDLGLFGNESGRVRLSVVGAVKAPLANAGRGFGTGEWDAGAGFSGSASLGATTVFGDAVYWKLGNPAGASLRNAVAYSLSVGRPLSRSRWSLLGTVYGASSLWAGLEPPVQVGAGVGYLLESGSSVFATAAGGLTHSAPAISTALGWRVPLGKTP